MRGPSRPERPAEASTRTRRGWAGWRGGEAPAGPGWKGRGFPSRSRAGWWVRGRGRGQLAGAPEAERAEGGHFAAGEVAEHEVQFSQRSIALRRRRVRAFGLGEHERFLQRLLAGGEMGPQGILPAGAAGLPAGVRSPRSAPRPWRVQPAQDRPQRPADEVHEGLGIRERGGGGLGTEQVHPAGADRRGAARQGLEERGLHGASKPHRTEGWLRAGWSSLRAAWRSRPGRRRGARIRPRVGAFPPSGPRGESARWRRAARASPSGGSGARRPFWG